MSALKLVVSSHAGNHFSLQSHNRLRVSITSSFSSTILEKEFSCTDVMLLPLRSRLLNLSSPINAFFVMDFKWFAANPNFSNRFNPTNTPLISSMVVAIRLKFSSLKSTFYFITYLHNGVCAAIRRVSCSVRVSQRCCRSLVCQDVTLLSVSGAWCFEGVCWHSLPPQNSITSQMSNIANSSTACDSLQSHNKLFP